MKSFLVKLYSAVIFVSVEIEAFRKQVRSDIGTCHFDNTTCPLKINVYPKNTSKQDESCQKKKKDKVFSKLLLKNNTSLIQNYKDVMMISASVKNKATCQNNTAENAVEHGKNNPELDLEVLLNEKEWKKNFASIECGAKLIKSSKNLKHPNHIINKNNDEYMLFECIEETFFTIELCETIKVIRFELDNFELYSGTPKNFTVRTIDKYSNNINQWIVIGNFEASSDKMEAQNFSDLKIKSFGKFIRVDVNSFHGTEHFCTLTSFRVFGMSEYEYLSLTEDDVDDENNTGIEEVTIQTESIVETRLQELEMKTQKTQLMKEQTTMLSYKYIFLQMRNDVCIDSVQFESFTKQGIVKNKENIKSIEVSTVEKKIIDVSQGKVTDINVPKKVQNLTKFDVNGSAPTVPKDSVLVQISNRVKILEKNITVQNNILKNFNVSSKQQANDINKILETILKAKEVFQETAGENEAVKGDVNELNKKVSKFEELILEYAEALKLMMALTIFLSILCLFLISLICFKPGDVKMVEVDDEVDTAVGTIDQEEEYKEEKCNIKDIHVQTDSPIIKKRVTFSDDEKEVRAEGSEEDISYKLTARRRVRRRDPARRVTWCGGTFRKLAEEAAFLVKEL